MLSALDPLSFSGDPFRDPDQKKLHSQLRMLIGPGAASFFRDACLMMNNDLSLETQSHLIGHCIREVDSALRYAVKPLKVAIAKDAGSGSNGTHQRIIKTILALLQIEENGEAARKWLKYSNDDPDGMAKRAHRRSFLPPRKIDDAFKSYWEDMQVVFRVVLNRVEANLGRALPRVRELAKESPTKNVVNELTNHVPHNNMLLEAFFDSISDVRGWIEALNNKGFFSRPPEPEKESINGNDTLRFPRWPQSKFLVRVAHDNQPETQGQIADVILTIPETKNVFVLEDFIDAALVLPVLQIKKLVPKLIASLDTPYASFRLPKLLGDLLNRLSAAGDKEAAFFLAKELFRLSHDEVRGDTRSRYEEWEYQENLRKTIPSLARTGGIETLSLLCKLLNESTQTKVEDNPREDFSRVWIEDIGGGSGSPIDIRESLVFTIRDCAKQLFEDDLATIDEIEGVLAGFDFYIFERLLLHFLHNSDDAPTPLLAKYLLNEECFDRDGIEYDRLLAASFPRLDKKQQELILSWIEKEGDVSDWEDANQKEKGTKPSTRIGKERSIRLMLQRLHPIKEGLRGDWAKKYQQWTKQFDSYQKEYPGTSVTWVGPTSPKSKEELKTMSVDQVIDYLKSWMPEKGHMVDTPEGLGRILTEVVKENPGEYSQKSTRLKELDPTYVRSTLFGLEQAVKERAEIAWGNVLELCEWVAMQPRDTAESKVHDEYRDLDPGWGWTRKEIASLLGTGFSAARDEIPCSLAGRAWSALKPLLEDPDPSLTQEKEVGKNSLDAATMAINTVRGEALEATVWFSIFLMGCSEKNPQRKSEFGSILAEVKKVFEKHLDKQHDPSIAVHSMFGKHFPRLVYIDKEWAAGLKSAVFPTHDFPNQYWKVAWESYLAFNPIFEDTHKILSDDYLSVIDYMRLETGDERSSRFDITERMAAYLIALYGKGKVDGLDKPGVISDFFSHAPTRARDQALESAGRDLWRNGKAMTTEIIERYVQLFDQRLTKALREKYEGHPQELQNFGYWFISDAVDQGWKEERLINVVRLTGKLEAIHHVVDALINMAGRKPVEAIEATRILIDRDSDAWFVPSYKDKIRSIIEAGTNTGDVGGEKAAKELANKLFAMGYAEFEDLVT